MILFEHDDSAFRERRFGPFEEVNSVLIIQVGNDPLDPDAVVFLCELKLLKAFDVEMSDVFVLEDLFGPFD